MLRVIGDLTVDEVAKTIGKRPGAVKALQRRGLAAVKRELEGKGVPL
jgi:RNA polymerase sigma-70 factor (ECF subfamily)